MPGSLRNRSRPCAGAIWPGSLPGLALTAIALGGCATTPDVPALTANPIAFRTVAGAPAMRDGRADFRRSLCANLRTEGLVTEGDPGCERWLWRLPDEPAPSAGGDEAAPAPAGTAVFIVTGAFSECVGEEAWPFVAGAARLRAMGARVETIVVGGRSGTVPNARQIAAALERARLPDDQQLILVGYSKGALDILRFLVDFPAPARRVHAAVSVAGPIFGSPLAAATEGAYATLVAKLPYEKCPPGDGQVVQSLNPAAARQWLESNPLPPHVRYYSLAAFTTREHMARSLVPTWNYLNRTDARNDGQVLAADAVIPGSTLLGLANADHWGIAESLERGRPFLAGRPDPQPFPLEQLFLSIVQFVAADLR